MNLKKTIALIYGGEGCEHEISVKSARNLYSAIDKSAFDVIPILITDDGSWYITDGISSSILHPTYPVRINSVSGFLINGKTVEVDAAIPALHGDSGEDGMIQGALQAAHIRYIGCGVGASAVCCDKAFTKIIAEHLGIKTAKYIIAEPRDKEDEVILRAEGHLSYPMFLKPTCLGSSVGAARAESRSELLSALRKARALSQRVLIEECVDVLYELECGFFDSCGKRMLSPSGRILTDGIFYDYGGKYLDKGSPKTAHGVSDNPKIEKEAADSANRLATVIGLTHLARIDFFVTRGGELYFNEINTFPGMTESSLYPLLTEDMGLSKNEFINLILTEVTG